jgi:hypothetical protein
MRGVYTAQYRIAAVTTAKTLMYFTAATDKPIEVLSASVTNESNESNEQILCGFQRITTLGTPTATTVTPAKHEPGDQAAASTVKANVTASEPTYGSIAQGADIINAYGLEGAASLSGWNFPPTPEERFTIKSGDSYGLRLVNTIASADLVVRVTFRELS